ncbi:hypothetical protein LXA43DRAFT_8872 [Ganoderma leucocontextum]|nr:hypothetical protein LXA43DRAFT_8872 [Ganoderma leucocontextum]
MMTFEQEVKTFWTGRVTGATIMFLLNRYIGLLYNLLNVIQRVTTLSDEVCAVMIPTTAISLQVLYLIYAAFTSLRMFAVSNKSWFLALVCFGLCMAPIVLSLASIYYHILLIRC